MMTTVGPELAPEKYNGTGPAAVVTVSLRLRVAFLPSNASKKRFALRRSNGADNNSNRSQTGSAKSSYKTWRIVPFRRHNMIASAFFEDGTMGFQDRDH
jgi:hypothetical protein